MDNNLQIFKNEEFGEARTIEENGQIYFCGSDVAKALGYADTPKAITTHCKEDGWAFRSVTDNFGRTQQAKFINEGNLYRLIVNSKLESSYGKHSSTMISVVTKSVSTGFTRIQLKPAQK